MLYSLYISSYLHHHATPHIIHRDIKGSNVLLDVEFHAKVADFGFAKLMPDGATHVTTKVKGTLGYLAPEYAMLGKASESCDVYSFGIFLLVLVSGKKPIERVKPTTKREISDWALQLARENKFKEIADGRMKGNFVEAEVKRVVLVGLLCAQNKPEKRPTMQEVVELLKGESKEKLDDLNCELFGAGLMAGVYPSGGEDSLDLTEEMDSKKEVTTSTSESGANAV
jgi:serine/threonine protein kinase